MDPSPYSAPVPTRPSPASASSSFTFRHVLVVGTVLWIVFVLSASLGLLGLSDTGTLLAGSVVLLLTALLLQIFTKAGWILGSWNALGFFPLLLGGASAMSTFVYMRLVGFNMPF
jgi:hypothetical protein